MSYGTSGASGLALFDEHGSVVIQADNVCFRRSRMALWTLPLLFSDMGRTNTNNKQAATVLDIGLPTRHALSADEWT